MCLLTYYPPGVLVDQDRLLNGAVANDDGHGYAIVDPVNGRLIIGHGLDGCAMITEFAKLRKQHPDGPALFHSRWSTGGTTSVDNCHPFHVGSDRRTVIAHNGVFFSPSKGDQRSDTRILAETIIPIYMPKLWGKVDRKRLAKYAGVGNRLVILTVNPKYDDSSYLINEDEGYWVGGVWYSNYGFCAPRSTYTTGRTWGESHWSDWVNDDAWEKGEDGHWHIKDEYRASPKYRWGPHRAEPCAICGLTYVVDQATDVCDNCGTCASCLEDASDGCECYVTTSAVVQQALRKAEGIDDDDDDDTYLDHPTRRTTGTGWVGATYEADRDGTLIVIEPKNTTK